MARAQLNVTSITRAGIAPTAPVASNAVDFNYLVNDGATFLEVKNTDVASRVLTVHLDSSVDGQAAAPKTYTITAGATRLIGPFPVTYYGAHLNIDSASALLTVVAYRV